MNKKKRFNSIFLLFFGMLCLATILAPPAKNIFAADLVAEAGPNQEVEVNETVHFDGRNSNGTIAFYSWDFGDGSHAVTQNPVCTQLYCCRHL